MDDRDVEPQPQPENDPHYFEPEINPFVADKMKRDKDFQDAAALQQNMTDPQATASPDEEVSVEDRLSELQRQNEEFRIQATKAQLKAARMEEKHKKDQRRLQELQQQAPMAPMNPYDSRALLGRSPEESVTAQDISNLMMSFAAAQGNRIAQLKDEIVEGLRESKQSSEIDPDAEAVIVEAHPWLLSMDEASRQRAIADLSRSTQQQAVAPAQAPARPRPLAGPSVEQARARVRDAGYIETSNRGAQAERTMQNPARVAQAQKFAELKAALTRTDGKGSDLALKILADLGAGPQDDFDSGFAKMR